MGSRSCITITAHVIKNWKLMTSVLATRLLDERHTGEISERLAVIKKEFSISEMVALVTNNASSMKKAGEKVNIEHWFCFSHGLQLAIE